MQKHVLHQCGTCLAKDPDRQKKKSGFLNSNEGTMLTQSCVYHNTVVKKIAFPALKIAVCDINRITLTNYSM